MINRPKGSSLLDWCDNHNWWTKQKKQDTQIFAKKKKKKNEDNDDYNNSDSDPINDDKNSIINNNNNNDYNNTLKIIKKRLSHLQDKIKHARLSVARIQQQLECLHLYHTSWFLCPIHSIEY